MKDTPRLLGALLGAGALLQVLAGELGLVNVIRDIHAAIGLAGLLVVALYIYYSPRRAYIYLFGGLLLTLVAAQAYLGLALYGLIPLTPAARSGIEASHRLTAYLILIMGLAGGILARRLRSREAGLQRAHQT